MGFLDKMKETAGDIADDTVRAGKLAQAQLKLRSLQGELDAAIKEFGTVAHGLFATGAIAHADLDGPGRRIAVAEQAIVDKNAEIAALKAEPPGT